MYPQWQNLIFIAFLIIWFAGAFVLFVRYLARENTYLRQFPPVDGVPLDAWPPSGNPFGARNRAVRRAQGQQQPNPELEHQRLGLRRRWRYVMFWVFGFPLLFIVVVIVVNLLLHAARVMHWLP
jgi:hypothetical protein